MVVGEAPRRDLVADVEVEVLTDARRRQEVLRLVTRHSGAVGGAGVDPDQRGAHGEQSDDDRHDTTGVTGDISRRPRTRRSAAARAPTARRPSPAHRGRPRRRAPCRARGGGCRRRARPCRPSTVTPARSSAHGQALAAPRRPTRTIGYTRGSRRSAVAGTGGRRSPTRGHPVEHEVAASSSLDRPAGVAHGAGHLGAQHRPAGGIGAVAVVLRLRDPGQGDVGVGHVVGVDLAVAILVDDEVHEQQPAVLGTSQGVGAAGGGGERSERRGPEHPAGLERRAIGERRARRRARGDRGPAAPCRMSTPAPTAAAARRSTICPYPRRGYGTPGPRGATCGRCAGRATPAVHADPPAGQLAGELLGVDAPELGGHRAVEPLERRRAQPGPHELGVGVVARRGASGRVTRSPAMRAPIDGGTWRSRSVRLQREADPATSEVQAPVALAGLQVGRRAARRGGRRPAAAPTGAAGGCRGRRAGRRRRSWRPSHRRGRPTRRAPRAVHDGPRPTRGQPGRPAADRHHVGRLVTAHRRDGDRAVAGDEPRAHPWCRRRRRRRCDCDEQHACPEARRSS